METNASPAEAAHAIKNYLNAIMLNANLAIAQVAGSACEAEVRESLETIIKHVRACDQVAEHLSTSRG